jgi:phenylacetate-CoA ligase
MVTDLVKRFPRVEKLARQLMSLYPLSARLGPFFWKWYALLQESETWSVEELRAYQFEQLKRLLPRLIRTSPFYRARFADVAVDQLNDLATLQRSVPELTRQEFDANYAAIRSGEFGKRSRYLVRTSGTTGRALQFVHPTEDRAREWASICHQWKRVGYDPVRSARAEFRGLTHEGTLSQDFPDQNMVRFSILDLRSNTLPRIAEIIRDRELRFFHGYPSALYLLAREVQRSGMRFPQPEAVLLASEMAYDFQIEQIRQAFPDSRLFAHYGCAEYTVLAGWCEHRQAYHVLPQYSLVEIDGKTREIVGTNLYNDLNGFVRYRMTDTASGVETAPCSKCRRPYPLVLTGLDGRHEDYLYSRERGWIAPAIVTYPLKHLHCIQEVQFLQEKPDEVVLRYLARPGATDEMAAGELADIETGFHRLMGKGTRLRACQVKDLPRGPTGKYKWIISQLDPRTAPPRDEV